MLAGLKWLALGWRDDLLLKLAHRIPTRLAYWVGVRMAVFATSGQWGNENVPRLLAAQMLDRWYSAHGLDR